MCDDTSPAGPTTGAITRPVVLVELRLNRSRVAHRGVVHRLVQLPRLRLVLVLERVDAPLRESTWRLVSARDSQGLEVEDDEIWDDASQPAFLPVEEGRFPFISRAKTFSHFLVRP